MKRGAIRASLKEFDIVICDKVHFFYSDSDFNGYGTYVLLQALIEAAFFKTMIFMTAILLEVFLLLEKTLLQCERKMRSKNPAPNIEKYCYTGEVHNYGHLADYSRFSCYDPCDPESLMEEVAKSEKKTLFFMDDVARAQKNEKLT